MRTVLKEKQWSTLLKILTLDLALPFYEAMGVPVSEPLEFQRFLRVTLEEALQAEAAQEVREAPRPSYPSLVISRLGADAKQLAEWGNGVYLGNHSEQPELSAWKQILFKFQYRNRGELDFLADDKQSFYHLRYRETAEIEDIEAEEEEALQKPLSDWDLGIYALEGYGCAWESSPFSTMELLIQLERMKRFAAEFWTILTPLERSEFYRRGQAYLNQERIWMPGPLLPLEELLDAR